MDPKHFSDQTKNFLQNIANTGEKWLAEEVKKIYEQSTDENDFLEELNLYLMRMELKVKALKEACEKLTSI